MRALHHLGPDYQSTFSPTESSAVLEQARPAPGTAQALPESEAVDIITGRDALRGRLVLSYSARVRSQSSSRNLARRGFSILQLQCLFAVYSSPRTLD